MQLQPLELQSSKILALILIAVHGGALMSLNISSLPIAIRMILAALIVLSGVLTLNKYHFLQNIVGIKTDKKNQWSLINSSGEIISAQLKGDSICTQWLVILNFRVQDVKKIYSIVILPDSLDHDNFRRLRAYLRVLSRKL